MVKILKGDNLSTAKLCSPKPFGPMLACPDDIGVIPFPCLVSHKFDGVRMLIRGTDVVSRKLLKIPNKHVQELFGLDVLEGMDGEGIVGDPTSPTVYNKTESGVMSQDGKPDVWFYAFDLHNEPTLNFESRYRLLKMRVQDAQTLGVRVKLVEHTLIHTKDELYAYKKEALRLGFEGAMARKIDGPYKYGRSTPREQFLTKLKDFQDAEAVVIGLEELMRNTNAKGVDELGHAKRSSAKAGMVAGGTLGKFVCQNPETGEVFRIGTGKGLTQRLRQEIWDKHKSEGGIIGQFVKYKHQPSGAKDKPRLPVWLGFRSEIDK